MKAGNLKLKTYDFYFPIGSQKSFQSKGTQYIVTVPKETREHEFYLNALRYETPLTKLANYAVRDLSVRVCCFLSPSILQLIVRDQVTNKEKPLFPEYVTFPYTKESAESIGKIWNEKVEGYKKKIESDEEWIKEFMELYLRMFTSLSLEMTRKTLLDTVTSNKYVTEAFRNKNPDARKKLVSNLLTEKFKEVRDEEEFKKRMEEFEKRWRRFLDMFSTINDVITAESLLERKDIMSDFFGYCALALGQYDPNDLFRMIRLLDRENVLINGTVEGFCLNSECNYHFTKKGLVEITGICENCEKKTLNLYSAQFSSDVKPAWELGLLPEIVAAYIVMEKEWAKEVFLHKQIQTVKEGKTSKAAQIDVVVHTSSDDVVFIEATSAHALDELFQKFQKKVSRLESLGIPYDSLIFVTGCPEFEYPSPIPDKKAVMLGLRHIKDLPKRMDGWLEKTISH